MEEAAAAATKRRARSGGGSAEEPDRLSALPDELLRRVLTFLPSQDVVRTTVLSKRWVDLWRSVPAINLIYTPSCKWSWEKMKDFATNLLMLHNAEFLDAFKLTVYHIGYVDSRQDADRWIRRAMKFHPLLLDIIVPTSTRQYQLHFPSLASSLCRLKKLFLHGLHLEHSFAKLIRSGCPVLEDLVLWSCRNEFPHIQSDTLKSLVVRGCLSEAAGVLRVKAPALSSLCLDFGLHEYTDGALLEAGHSLVRASVSLMSAVAPQRGATEILVSLANVTSLKLCGFHATAVLDKELDELPIFDNLKTLSLDYMFASKCHLKRFKALGLFLQKTPMLEKLTLTNFYYHGGVKSAQQMLGEPSVKTVEFPMLENLRTLFLGNCGLFDNYRMLRHFLENSPNLEKLTVRLCKFSGTSNGGKGKAKSKKTNSQLQNVTHFQCQKLKSTEIIYDTGDKIPELVSILLDISGTAPKNTITLTKV